MTDIFFNATMWKFTSFFLFYLIATLALEPVAGAFNCSNVEVDGIKFDLSSLNKTNEYNNTIESTPPTFTKITYQINPCSPLSYEENKKPKDSCEDSAYACQIIYNYLSETEDGERAINIRPIAGGELDQLDPKTTLVPVSSNGEKDERQLSIILHGGSYKNESQKANITFICIKGKNDSIISAKYKENTLFMEWETGAACGEKLPEEDKDKRMGGFTKFIIILVIIGLCYFGLGAAYNYHVYKAHGWDLLPHLDFWRDFPYLISDVFKYLVNSFRTSNRAGGYSRI